MLMSMNVWLGPFIPYMSRHNMHNVHCTHVKHVKRQVKHEMKTDQVFHRQQIHHNVYTESTVKVASSYLFGKTLVAFS